MSLPPSNDAITDFLAVADVDRDVATFFLESAGWDVAKALSAYYEAGPSASTATTAAPAANVTHTTDISPVSRLPGPTNTSAATSGIMSAPSQPTTGSSRINTLPSAADPPKDVKANTYYAGGDRSGIAVQGPPISDANTLGARLVNDILKKARNVSENDDDEESDAGLNLFGNMNSSSTGFGSTARGGNGEQRQNLFFGRPITLDPSASSSTQAQSASNQTSPPIKTEIKRSITFWKGGFTIGDEPRFYPYNDSDSVRILERIQSGRALTEVFGVAHDAPVALSVIQRFEEVYVPPKTPFSSSGQTLASSLSSSSSSSSTGTSDTSATANLLPGLSVPASQVTVDSSQATTRLQYRGSTGRRIVMSFNRTHLVRHVYAQIAHDASESRPFVLMNPMNQKIYRDLDQTVEEAGLLDCAIVPSFC